MDTNQTNENFLQQEISPIKRHQQCLVIGILVALVSMFSGVAWGYQVKTNRANEPLASVKQDKLSQDNQEVLLPNETDSNQKPICDQDVRTCNDGTEVGRIGPKCQFDLCPHDQIVQKLGEDQAFYILAANVESHSETETLSEQKHVILLLPAVSTVGGAHYNQIQINQTIYKITPGGGGGPCDWEEDDCTYSDEEMPSTPLLRLFTRSGRVFAFNPQQITVDGYDAGDYVITKQSSDPYFTETEVELWKNLFIQAQVITPESQASSI